MTYSRTQSYYDEDDGDTSYTSVHAQGTWSYDTESDILKLSGEQAKSQEDFKHAPDGPPTKSKGAFSQSFKRAELVSSTMWKVNPVS